MEMDARDDKMSSDTHVELDATYDLLVSDNGVHVNARPVRVLWDAMSSRSVLNRACAERLGIGITDHNTSVRFDFAARGLSKVERKRTAQICITVHDDADHSKRVAFNADVLVSDSIDAFELVIGRQAHAFLAKNHDLHMDVASNVINLSADVKIHHTARDDWRAAGEVIFTVSATDAVEQAPGGSTELHARPPADTADEAELRRLEASVRHDFADLFTPLGEGEPRPQLPGRLTVEFNELGPHLFGRPVGSTSARWSNGGWMGGSTPLSAAESSRGHPSPGS